MEQWTSLPKAIAKRIESMIAAGDFAPDARLPSQRELSSRFQVSRTSIREALSILAASGVLRTEPGRGSYCVLSEENTSAVDGGDVTFPLQGISSEILNGVSKYSKLEISRFRHVIEAESGRLAAMRITDDEIQLLERNLNVFKDQTRAIDLDSSAGTDFEFHQLIVQFSGVQLFADLHLAFRDLVMRAVRMQRTLYKRAWEPVVEHERILEALKRRDPDETAYYLQSHITRSAERLGIVNARDIF